MEVCRPPLLWINGACYRVNQIDEKVTQQTFDAIDEYEDETFDFTPPPDDEEDCQYEIISQDNGRCMASFHVASTFFPILIGKKGLTKKRIESDTRTKITIPKQGVENEDIKVTGDNRFAVVSASNRIDSIVASARQRQGFTHFISIPVNSSEIQKDFNEFKSQVLESCSDARGLDETVFQTGTLLHMTIGTLALMDETERQKAIKILHNILEDVQQLEISVNGLEIMNDDPAEVDVIYAKIVEENSEKLQEIVDFIVAEFAKTGLMPKQFDRVKLHITVVNTLFRKDEEFSEEKVRETLDSRQILELFGDKSFASVTLKEVHLSQRRAGKRTKENYYFPSTIVKLK